VVAAFAGTSLIGMVLLLLPVATADGRSTSVLDALFTATSAVCVTGLIVVDTPTHWSPFGQGVILALIQVGGFGIMTLSSLIVVVLSKRLGLRHRLVAAAETGSLDAGDVRRVLVGVARFTVAIETVAAALLFLRFWAGHGEPVGRAASLGLFHAVSAFNNAGFALFSDSLMGYATDPVTLLVIAAAVIIGGLGYPVWVEIARAPRRPSRWSLHAKITVTATLALLAVGSVLMAWFEWTNPATMGELSIQDSILNAFFHSVMPRTAGFNSIDIAAMREPSRLLTEVLMFIGGGSASTAGGIKVSTFALLGWVMWAEARGDADVVVFERRVPETAHRQALTVALLAVGVVISSTMLLMAITNLPRTDLFFETVSALGTVGLSTGVTPLLPDSSQVVVIGLMLLGRVGPVTLFAGLVLRERSRRYRPPAERPLVG
jgi:trk system potassium uptake protein